MKVWACEFSTYETWTVNGLMGTIRPIPSKIAVSDNFGVIELSSLPSSHRPVMSSVTFLSDPVMVHPAVLAEVAEFGNHPPGAVS